MSVYLFIEAKEVSERMKYGQYIQKVAQAINRRSGGGSREAMV